MRVKIGCVDMQIGALYYPPRKDASRQSPDGKTVVQLAEWATAVVCKSARVLSCWLGYPESPGKAHRMKGVPLPAEVRCGWGPVGPPGRGTPASTRCWEFMDANGLGWSCTEDCIAVLPGFHRHTALSSTIGSQMCHVHAAIGIAAVYEEIGEALPRARRLRGRAQGRGRQGGQLADGRHAPPGYIGANAGNDCSRFGELLAELGHKCTKRDDRLRPVICVEEATSATHEDKPRVFQLVSMLTAPYQCVLCSSCFVNRALAITHIGSSMKEGSCIAGLAGRCGEDGDEGGEGRAPGWR